MEFTPGVSGAGKVSILTAGKDPTYALGLLEGLVSRPLTIDFLADDEMQLSPLAKMPNVNYLNVRSGDQSETVPLRQRVTRFARHYLGLLKYAATTDSKLFHILWYNSIEWFDNSLLLLYYRLMGKRIVYTVHNVNTRERDSRSRLIDRLALKYLYKHVDHILVHSELVKSEIVGRYSVDPGKISVIPFGVNNVVPRTGLTKARAREILGIENGQKILLFFGRIAPYKGLDLMMEALDHLPECRLLIIGRIKEGFDKYRKEVEGLIAAKNHNGRIYMRTDFVPDEEVEIYFKASDLVVLPYKNIYQSGVPFLSYSFGVPVVATNVGSLADSVVEGVTGYVSAPEDPRDLAAKISLFFQSDMYRDNEATRETIIRYVNENHSWDRVSDIVCKVYKTVSGSNGA